MLPLGQFAPDQAAIDPNSSEEARNVIPASLNGGTAYRPFPELAISSTTPLSAQCQGADTFRSDDGAIGHYAGDATKLYIRLGGTWTSAGTGYTTDAASAWKFGQYGSLAIAVNGFDPPQKDTIGTGAFANLGGSPPVAYFICECKDYVFLGKLSTDLTAIQWCETNNPESWPIGSLGGDIQPLPDTGQVQGLVGGDFVLAFTEYGIHRFDFVGGDIGFQRRQIGFDIGATISGSVCGFKEYAFFYHQTGFYSCIGGNPPVPIGVERVNRWFKANYDSNRPQLVSSAIDPENNLYILAFADKNETMGFANHFLVYNWALDRWAHVADPDDATESHAVATLFRDVSATVYTMEDLDVYGTMEDVPYSLDSPVWVGTGLLLLGFFGTDNNSGNANGAAKEAVVETAEAQLITGKEAYIRSIRGMVDADNDNLTYGLTIRSRNTLNAMLNDVDGTYHAADGTFKFRARGRYQRAQFTIPAGADWNYILGIDDVQAQPIGVRGRQ